MENYPNIDSVSIDFLGICKSLGLLDSLVGKSIISQVNDYLGGASLRDRDLESAIESWKNNQFCYGYFVNTNDTEFANYLKHRLSARHY